MAEVSPKTVRNWLGAGMIKAVRLGRRRFVPLSSIEAAFTARQRVAQELVPERLERQIAFVRGDLGRAGAVGGGVEDENED